MMRLALLSPIAALGLTVASGAKAEETQPLLLESDGVVALSDSELASLRGSNGLASDAAQTAVLLLPAFQRARERAREPRGIPQR